MRVLEKHGVSEAGRWVGRHIVPFAFAPKMHSRPMQLLARVPLPRRRFVPPPSWPDPVVDTPASLQTVPGIWRDPEEEERAHHEVPLRSVYANAVKDALPWSCEVSWRFIVPSFFRILWANTRTLARPPAAPTVAPAEPIDREALTAAVRAEARRLGLSQVGFAPYDEKYTYAGGNMWSKEGITIDEDTVIVCVIEQDWEHTQHAPDAKGERSVLRIYDEITRRSAALADFIHRQGYTARAHHFSGHMISIHYGVQAGLGQLGLNGQLLTPQAGSRCRLSLITTSAPLVHGAPVDYGMHAICDQCQLCVKRCPPGAIPNKRAYYRGIKKAKIKTERCWPTVMQAHGCAVCMKVCPIQRYGLEAVKTHLVATGEILGKGTDELEGFTWIDGVHYGPGQKPRLPSGFLEPGKMLNLTAAKAAEPEAAKPVL